MKSGPIIVIEDDPDDQELFEEAVRRINYTNTLLFFNNCIEAWKYLQETSEQPFVIFSDVNLPMQTGLEFKRRIDADEKMRKKSIPFLFYSTAINQEVVNEAYTTLNVQGFFKKSSNFSEMQKNLQLILDYWSACKHPNTI